MDKYTHETMPTVFGKHHNICEDFNFTPKLGPVAVVWEIQQLWTCGKSHTCAENPKRVRQNTHMKECLVYLETSWGRPSQFLPALCAKHTAGGPNSDFSGNQSRCVSWLIQICSYISIVFVPKTWNAKNLEENSKTLYSKDDSLEKNFIVKKSNFQSFS